MTSASKILSATPPAAPQTPKFYVPAIDLWIAAVLLVGRLVAVGLAGIAAAHGRSDQAIRPIHHAARPFGDPLRTDFLPISIGRK